MRKIPIAVTGGPASGKSTVLAAMAEFGLRTVSADDIVRDMWSDPSFQVAFKKTTGWSGPVNKRQISEKAFQDDSFRTALEMLFHGQVLAKIVREAPDVAEVPLLFETCIQSLFENVVSVACGELEQLRRLTLRLGNAEAAIKLVQSQLNEAVKISLADFTIRTDGSSSDVNTCVRSVLVQTGLLDVE